jgi:hypothetical protein
MQYYRMSIESLFILLQSRISKHPQMMETVFRNAAERCGQYRDADVSHIEISAGRFIDKCTTVYIIALLRFQKNKYGLYGHSLYDFDNVKIQHCISTFNRIYFRYSLAIIWCSHY